MGNTPNPDQQRARHQAYCFGSVRYFQDVRDAEQRVGSCESCAPTTSGPDVAGDPLANREQL